MIIRSAYQIRSHIQKNKTREETAAVIQRFHSLRRIAEEDAQVRHAARARSEIAIEHGFTDCDLTGAINVKIAAKIKL